MMCKTWSGWFIQDLLYACLGSGPATDLRSICYHKCTKFSFNQESISLTWLYLDFWQLQESHILMHYKSSIESKTYHLIIREKVQRGSNFVNKTSTRGFFYLTSYIWTPCSYLQANHLNTMFIFQWKHKLQ